MTPDPPLEIFPDLPSSAGSGLEEKGLKDWLPTPQEQLAGMLTQFVRQIEHWLVTVFTKFYFIFFPRKARG
jgi:hypothetical protein